MSQDKLNECREKAKQAIARMKGPNEPSQIDRLITALEAQTEAIGRLVEVTQALIVTMVEEGDDEEQTITQYLNGQPIGGRG